MPAMKRRGTWTRPASHAAFMPKSPPAVSRTKVEPRINMLGMRTRRWPRGRWAACSRQLPGGIGNEDVDVSVDQTPALAAGVKAGAKPHHRPEDSAPNPKVAEGGSLRGRGMVEDG